MNTKYISSSALKKISIFHECVARVKMLIFSPHEMKFIWYLPRKSKFSFYFILNGNTEIITLLFFWSSLARFDFCSVFIGYNIGCKHSLHLENGLDTYFNEWNARNQHLKKVYWVCLREASRANWRYARSNSDVIMFDVDVTTCVALIWQIYFT